jgi:hypothetical protein
VESDPIGLRGLSYSTYAYVRESPISYRDPRGLAPGDSFPSAEAAAIDALNYISQKNDRCAREYAGYVYKEWSLFGSPTYTYDEPTGLGWVGGALPNIPSYHGTYAMFHNHPSVPYANNYSPDDKDTADSLNIPSYLLTPTGPILVYVPVPRSPEGGYVTPVGQSQSTCDCH